MTLQQSLQKTETLCENKLNETAKLQPDNKFFTPDVIETFRKVASFIGVDYERVSHTCDFVVTRNGSTFLSLPYLFSNGSKPCVRWGNDVFPLDLTQGNENDAVDIDSKDRYMSLDVLFSEDEDPFELRLKPNPDIEMPSAMKLRKQLGKDKLADYLKTEYTIMNLAKFDGAEVVIQSEDILNTKTGRQLPLLILSDGTAVWKPKNFEAKLPVTANIDGSTLYYTDDDGVSGECSLKGRSFRKLNELDKGEYKVTGYTWMESDYGAMSVLYIDGESYRGNSKVAKTLSVLTPTITEDNPATLVILGQTQMSNGNVKVNCRLEVSNPEDPLADAIDSLVPSMEESSSESSETENEAVPF